MVVGDQSSGKSSLLEGLTGLNFPIASDLCTRFATQIILCRAPADVSGARVSIIPGPTASNQEAYRAHLLEFDVSIDGYELNAENFAIILDRVRI